MSAPLPLLCRAETFNVIGFIAAAVENWHISKKSAVIVF
jgi:hypothetical protein